MITPLLILHISRGDFKCPGFSFTIGNDTYIKTYRSAWRGEQGNIMGSKAFIAVAGNMGTGKSTLVEFIAKNLKIEPMFEPFEDNPFLADFYSDMKRWSFHSQIFFLNKKFALHKRCEAHNEHIILDRTIYEDAEIFAKNLRNMGFLSADEFKTYMMLYNSLLETLRRPSVLVYLKCDLRILYKRITQQRRRKYEASIPYDYVKSLQILYQRWIYKYRQMNMSPVIPVDTGKSNYLDDIFRRAELIEKLHKVLNGTLSHDNT